MEEAQNTSRETSSKENQKEENSQSKRKTVSNTSSKGPVASCKLIASTTTSSSNASPPDDPVSRFWNRQKHSMMSFFCINLSFVAVCSHDIERSSSLENLAICFLVTLYIIWFKVPQMETRKRKIHKIRKRPLHLRSKGPVYIIWFKAPQRKTRRKRKIHKPRERPFNLRSKGPFVS